MRARLLWVLAGLLVVLVPGARPGGTAAAAATNNVTWAWGDNSNGQLGQGSAGPGGPSPVQVNSLSGVVGVAGGFLHSLALEADGTVWAWGADGSGQLGNGTALTIGCRCSGTPAQVLNSNGSPLGGVVAVAAGDSDSLALKPDGTVWAWGANGNGQLGNGTFGNPNNPCACFSTPVQVVKSDGTAFSGVIAVAAGSYYSLALKGDGSVWAWGRGFYGELGTGTSAADVNTPVLVNGLSGVIAIASGGAHGLALLGDGTVRAWGKNEHGQLGNGTVATTGCFCSGLVQVANSDGTPLGSVTAVAGGGYHSLALKGDGTLRAWGNDGAGELGDGGSTDSSRAVPVAGPDGRGSLTNVSAIAGGSFFSLALRSDHSVWSWGSNGNGQLGDGTTTDRHLPVPMIGLSGVVAVAGGGGYSVALTPPAVTLSLQPDAKQALWPTIFSQSSLILDLQAVIPAVPAQKLGDWTVDLVFDPAALQPTTCSFSKALSPVSQCNLTYKAGRVRVAGAVGSGQALSGTVDLATVAFKVLAAPNSPISVRPRALALGDPAPELLGGLQQSLSMTATAAADVNRDGTVNTYDAACVLNDVATKGMPAGTSLCPASLPQRNYNVNQDKGVDATDVLCVLLAATGQKATTACPPFAVVGAEIPGAAPRAAAPASVSTSRWASVRLTPRTSSAKQGESVTLTLEARAPAGIGAWTVDLTYDPALIRVENCDAGDGMAVCNPDLAANTIRITGASVAGQTSLTPATVSFTLIGAAGRTAALKVKAVTLDDPAGAALSAMTSGATLTIKR